jgi:hypothetical protein
MRRDGRDRAAPQSSTRLPLERGPDLGIGERHLLAQVDVCGRVVGLAKHGTPANRNDRVIRPVVHTAGYRRVWA